MAEEENRVCVVDCCIDWGGSTAARLLSELTGSEVKDAERPVKWTVSNRYYEAEVWLEVKGHPGHDKGAWQALIAICNLSEPISVTKAYSVWEELQSETTPPVNLLVGVVGGCGLGESGRSETVQWCLEKGVELVEWELEPKPQNEEEVEDDFPESVGVARISEALQAHMWPVMDLRRSGRGGRGEVSTTAGCVASGERENGEAVDDGRSKRTSDGSASANDENSTAKEAASRTTDGGGRENSSKPFSANSCEVSTSSEARLDALLGASDLERGGEERDAEDFETLFAKCAEMKAHAQNLPDDERKAYAEKVVMSFWKAVGGDEEEVGSGSDS